MKSEKLLEAIGEIDDNLIYGAVNDIKGKKKWVQTKWSGIAACLCLAVMGGIIFNALKVQDFNAYIMKPGINSIDASAHVTYVEIGNRVACYYEVPRDNSKLDRYLGELYLQTDNGTWFYPYGIDNLKYLINQTADGTLSLWEFSDFVVSDGETYTYGDVLEIIYEVDSAEDIVSITASPSRSNNTALGREIQAQVGTHTYTDTEDIATFYNIIINVECFGADSASTSRSNRFTYSFSTSDPDKLTSGESTYATRDLSIELVSGTTIDSWKYDALQGSFYEYGGIFTEPLSDQEVYALNEIFGIR